MNILSDTGFLSVRDSLLVFTMAVQFSNATSPFLREQGHSLLQAKCQIKQDIPKCAHKQGNVKLKDKHEQYSNAHIT